MNGCLSSCAHCNRASSEGCRDHQRKNSRRFDQPSACRTIFSPCSFNGFSTETKVCDRGAGSAFGVARSPRRPLLGRFRRSQTAGHNLRLTQPPLQLMNRTRGRRDIEGKAARVAASACGRRTSFKRERHLGNIRVTEGIGRIACGWLNYCVSSRLRNKSRPHKPIYNLTL